MGLLRHHIWLRPKFGGRRWGLIDGVASSADLATAKIGVKAMGVNRRGCFVGLMAPAIRPPRKLRIVRCVYKVGLGLGMGFFVLLRGENKYNQSTYEI